MLALKKITWSRRFLLEIFSAQFKTFQILNGSMGHVIHNIYLFNASSFFSMMLHMRENIIIPPFAWET